MVFTGRLQCSVRHVYVRTDYFCCVMIEIEQLLLNLLYLAFLQALTYNQKVRQGSSYQQILVCNCNHAPQQPVSQALLGWLKKAAQQPANSNSELILQHISANYLLAVRAVRHIVYLGPAYS